MPDILVVDDDQSVRDLLTMYLKKAEFEVRTAADGVEALVADNETEFACKCIELYTDEALWHKLRTNALDYARKNFDPSLLKQKLEKLLERATTTRKTSDLAHDKPII